MGMLRRRSGRRVEGWVCFELRSLGLRNSCRVRPADGRMCAVWLVYAAATIKATVTCAN